MVAVLGAWFFTKFQYKIVLEYHWPHRLRLGGFLNGLDKRAAENWGRSLKGLLSFFFPKLGLRATE